jgi:transcriptional regulator of acetoin/glycerol metabolism
VEQQRSPAAETPTAVEAMPTDALSLRDLERDHILKVLQEAQGNKSLAARRLGIERKTLYKKARRLGIDLGQENQ